MEVTRLNFARLLPQILSDISSATFIAFDMEMTGISADKRLQNTSIDVLQHRYMKLRESIRSFYPLQVGVCTFHQIDNRFEARPYSFYLFPRHKSNYERSFLIESGSAEFLSGFNFDFNKAFGQGINYTNSIDRFLIGLKRDDDAEVKDLQLMREAYLHVKDKLDAAYTGEPLILKLDAMPADVGEYITRELEHERGLKATLKTLETGWELQVVKGSDKRVEDDFSKVVLAMQGKPIVGHNMLLDAMHMYQKFIEPLPNSVDVFRHRFSKSFPHIYDTKHIILSSSALQNYLQAFRKNSLQHCFSMLEELGDRFDFPIESVSQVGIAEHDAVYDAYSTGILLIRSAQLLGFDKSSIPECLAAFKNAIPLAGRRPSLTFTSETLIENREDIFAVTGIPTSLTHEALQKQLVETYGPVVLYKIYWTDETVYVCPSSTESRGRMIEEVTELCSIDTAAGKVWLCPYSKFMQIDSKDFANV